MGVQQGGSTTESYTYDKVGNRLSSITSAVNQYNSSNELTSDATFTYGYDNNGNMTSKTDANAATTGYTWDFENRQTSVALPGTGGTVSFKYDPFGRRVQKNSSSGTTVYAYDGASIADEYDGTGNVEAQYAQGAAIDEPLAMNRAGTIAYYHADGVGSITSLTDNTGSALAAYTRDSFGKSLSSAGTLVNPFRYTAREWDSETGLYYYRARYYDPQTARFSSEDPLGFGGKDVNFYAYVKNSPMNFDDPFGLKLDPKPGSGPQGGIDLTNYYAAINYLGQDPAAAQMIALLDNRATTYNIVFEHDGNDYYAPVTHTINWDPFSALYCTCGGSQSPANGLLHEMAHAAGSGPRARALANTPDPAYDNLEERRVIRTFETPYSLRHGECVRHDHAGQPFNTTDPTSTTFILPPVPRPPLPPGLQ